MFSENTYNLVRKVVFSVNCFKRLLCVAVAIFLLCSSVLPAFAVIEEKGPVSETVYGPVRGLYYDGGECYFGIPYAKATTGALRFSPPVAPENWDNEFDAVFQPPKPFRRDTENRARIL